MKLEKKHLVSGNVSSGQVQEVKWCAPTKGRLKVNVDASVIPGAESFPVDMIIRDHFGKFIQAKNLRRSGSVSSFEVEVWGVYEALEWLEDLQINNADVETDSQLTVNTLRKDMKYNLEVGDVLEDCRSILRSNPNVLIFFVKRLANMVAHSLVRVPCRVNCHNIFMSPPSVVLETIMLEASLF